MTIAEQMRDKSDNSEANKRFRQDADKELSTILEYIEQKASRGFISVEVSIFGGRKVEQFVVADLEKNGFSVRPITIGGNIYIVVW
jgi:hypothetical protein